MMKKMQLHVPSVEMKKIVMIIIVMIALIKLKTPVADVVDMNTM